MSDSYKDLKKKAKELGLKYIGVSEENLAKAVSEAENTQTPPTDTASAPQELSKSEQKREKIMMEDLNGPYNTAVVMNGNKEIRRYTLEVHGEAFQKMASDFSDKKGYSVVMKEEKPALICPHCGGKIYQSK